MNRQDGQSALHPLLTIVVTGLLIVLVTALPLGVREAFDDLERKVMALLDRVPQLALALKCFVLSALGGATAWAAFKLERHRRRTGAWTAPVMVGDRVWRPGPDLMLVGALEMLDLRNARGRRRRAAPDLDALRPKARRVRQLRTQSAYALGYWYDAIARHQDLVTRGADAQAITTAAQKVTDLAAQHDGLVELTRASIAELHDQLKSAVPDWWEHWQQAGVGAISWRTNRDQVRRVSVDARLPRSQRRQLEVDVDALEFIEARRGNPVL